MASFADDMADIARPRSMEYVAGMAEGNECGANAQRLARLIAAAENVLATLDMVRAGNPHTARQELRAAIMAAKHAA